MPFTTNDDLLEKLQAMEKREAVTAVFHAAALADFRVERASAERKLSSRAGAVTLKLVPATKLIGRLREMFPNAWIVGWKYELDGTRADAIEKGRKQLVENSTDVCVVNGAAYGDGFGVLLPDGNITHVGDKIALCDFLAEQLAAT
jgi:phosphopantothenate---cysteine ligase (CTP)